VRALIYSAVALLVACGSVSQVVSTGQDTFMVESHGVAGNGSSATEKVKAYQAATAHCSALGKEFQPLSTNQTEPGWGKPPAAEVHFRCLAKSDPELGRPNMQPGASVIIEQRNR
jgi:hypothetical protein